MSLSGVPIFTIDQLQTRNVDRADLQPRKCVSVVNVSWFPTKVSQEKKLFFPFIYFLKFFVCLLLCLGNAACFRLNNLFPWQINK